MTTFDKNAAEYIYNLRREIFQDNLTFNIRNHLREKMNEIVFCCHMTEEQKMYFKNGYYSSIERDDYTFFKNNGRIGDVILLNIKRSLINNIYGIINQTDSAMMYTMEQKKEMARIMIERFEAM